MITMSDIGEDLVLADGHGIILLQVALQTDESICYSITRGQSAVPTSGEIAEVGWYSPGDLPSPVTNLAPRAIPDAVSGEYGFVREYPHR